MSGESDKISTDQYGRRKWNVDLYEKEAKIERISQLNLL